MLPKEMLEKEDISFDTIDVERQKTTNKMKSFLFPESQIHELSATKSNQMKESPSHNPMA